MSAPPTWVTRLSIGHGARGGGSSSSHTPGDVVGRVLGVLDGEAEGGLPPGPSLGPRAPPPPVKEGPGRPFRRLISIASRAGRNRSFGMYDPPPVTESTTWSPSRGPGRVAQGVGGRGGEKKRQDTDPFQRVQGRCQLLPGNHVAGVCGGGGSSLPRKPHKAGCPRGDVEPSCPRPASPHNLTDPPAIPKHTWVEGTGVLGRVKSLTFSLLHI